MTLWMKAVNFLDQRACTGLGGFAGLLVIALFFIVEGVVPQYGSMFETVEYSDDQATISFVVVVIR